MIVFGGPISISDLADAEQVRPPTISRLAKEMEWEGLVSRERDANDRRIVRLKATARGRRLLVEGRERRIAKLSGMVAELSAMDRRRLTDAASVLERLLPSRGHAGPDTKGS